MLRSASYRSDRAMNRVDLEGILPARVLRAVGVDPKQQLSLRYLHWDAFVDALEQRSLGTGIRQLAESELGANTLNSGAGTRRRGFAPASVKRPSAQSCWRFTGKTAQSQDPAFAQAWKPLTSFSTL